MKVILIGLGCIGSVLSFYLLKNINIELYVVTKRTINYIQLKDLKGNNYKSRVFNKIDINELLTIKDINVIIISCKVYENKNIINKLNNMNNIPPILLAQNGINIEYEFNNPKYIIYRIIITLPSYIDNNITIFDLSKLPLIYGPISEKNNNNSLEVMNILKKEGIINEFTNKESLVNNIWLKGAYNCCLNPLSCIYFMKMKYLMNNLYIKLLIEKILDEIINVSIAYNIILNKEDLQNMILLAPEKYSSMYEDIINNKETEIDYLNGMIVNLGLKKEINVLTNIEITNLIKNFNKKNNNYINNSEILITK